MDATIRLLIIGIYVVHALVAFLLLIGLKQKMKAPDYGVAVVALSFGLFLPFLAELAVYVVYRIAARFGRSGLIEDYDDYIDFKVVNYEQIRHEASNSTHLLPLTDAINSKDPAIRKHSILTHVNQSIDQQGKYLQMGLESTDSETVHYAAATMNILIDQYEQELKLAKREYDLGKPDTIHRLAMVYKRMIHSELITEVMLKDKRDAWLEELLKAKTLYPPTPWIYEDLNEIYLTLQRPKEQLNILKEYVHHFPERIESHLMLINYYYERERWNEVKAVMFMMQTQFTLEDVPYEYRLLFEEWSDTTSWKNEL